MYDSDACWGCVSGYANCVPGGVATTRGTEYVVCCAEGAVFCANDASCSYSLYGRIACCPSDGTSPSTYCSSYQTCGLKGCESVPGALSLSASPENVPADDKTTTTITATTSDKKKGVIVAFSTQPNDAVAFSAASCTTGDDGTCSVTARSKDRREAGVDIFAKAQGYSDGYTGVSFYRALMLSANPASLFADGVSKSTITVETTDRKSGVPVDFSGNILFSPASCTTGSSGTCSVFTMAQGVPMKADAYAKARGEFYMEGHVSVTFTEAPQLVLFATPATAPANGVSAITITAVAPNAAGSVPITFSSSRAQDTLSQSACYTDATGKCSVTVRSGSSGAATITGHANGYTDGKAGVVFILPATAQWYEVQRSSDCIAYCSGIGGRSVGCDCPNGLGATMPVYCYTGAGSGCFSNSNTGNCQSYDSQQCCCDAVPASTPASTCTLTSASIRSFTLYKQGEPIPMSATFSGPCATGSGTYLQIGAKSEDGACDIQLLSANPSISGSAYVGAWTAAIPQNCVGKNVYAYAARVWNGPPGQTGSTPLSSTLEDASITSNTPVSGKIELANCGIVDIVSIGHCQDYVCEKGETLGTTTKFSGLCTTGSNVYLQFNATNCVDVNNDNRCDSESTIKVCSIKYSGGDMPGITLLNPTISDGTYTGEWSVPDIPADCAGKNAAIYAARAWNGPPSQQGSTPLSNERVYTPIDGFYYGGGPTFPTPASTPAPTPCSNPNAITVAKETRSSIAPFWGWQSAQRFQMLFYKSEINQQGVIDKIYLKKYDSTEGTFDNLRIYLCHTDKTSITDNFADNCKDQIGVMSVVRRTISGAAGDWIEFDVDNDFAYNNVDNLVVEIKWNGNDGRNVPTWADTDANLRSVGSGSDKALRGTAYNYVHSFKASMCSPPAPTPTPTPTPASTALPATACTYRLSIAPKGERLVATANTWTITATDSSSASCPATILYNLIHKQTAGCTNVNIPDTLTISRGGTKQFQLSAGRVSDACAVTLNIKAPDGTTVDPDFVIASSSEYHWTEVVGDVSCLPPLSQIAMIVKYPMAASRLIPLTATGAPNFTKTMPIKFLVTAKTVDLVPNVCKGVNCQASYKLEGDVAFINAKWDTLSQEWTGEMDSSALSCDRYYTLNIKAAYGAGGEKTENRDVYINCNPTLVVEPPERRIALGSNKADTAAFKATIYDPLSRTYSLKMEDNAGNAVPVLGAAQWLKFDCAGVTGCTGAPKEITGAAAGRTYNVILVRDTAATRVGTYTVKYTAASGTGDGAFTRESKAALIVTSEALNEFALWQLAAMFALSLGIFAAAGSKTSGKR